VVVVVLVVVVECTWPLELYGSLN